MIKIEIKRKVFLFLVCFTMLLGMQSFAIATPTSSDVDKVQATTPVNSKITDTHLSKDVKNADSIISPTSSAISATETKKINQVLKEMILSDYDDIYNFGNFEFEYLEDKDSDGYIDVNVYVDMTLVRKPEASPFIIGMQSRSNEIIDSSAKESLDKEIEFYLDEISAHYLIPERTTFTYSVKYMNNNVNSLSSDGFNVYYRTDASEEIIRTSVEELAPVEDAELSASNGYQAADSFLQSDLSKSVAASSSFTYDRIAARDWARNNAFSTPEFPSQTVPGTDCANFVSKALNAGGIPEDLSGDWHRASTWGGWPGDNWYRTGYYSNGGVVTYMKNKGYFYKQSDESKVYAGSIMFWNNTSHVALVTYGDTVTIKYTQHGAIQSKDTVYRTEDASFYMPYDSIQ